MSEQSEQDFRDIERARDLPPDEPYPSRSCAACGAEADEPCRRPIGLHCVRDQEAANQ